MAGTAFGPARPGAAVGAGVAAPTTRADDHRPEILGRDAWGSDLPVAGPIEVEDDVRFLLVHHTASTNAYSPDQVADQIRGFYQFHTGPEKGWPDVAYNFFVDRYGGIWEARAGSVAGPVRGDATGGSQGFALLCSLIGNHAQEPVTPEARSSLIDLLAWLADRHGIDTTPGTTVDFVSRGSNRWEAGAPVTTTTIAGHRDMSQTSCPGDFAYDLLADDIPAAVTQLRLARSTTDSTQPPPPSSVPDPAETTTPVAPSEPASTSSSDPDDNEAIGSVAVSSDDGGLERLVLPAALVAGATGIGLGAVALRRASPAPEAPDGDDDW